jgi:hypothetical protein
MQRIPVDVGRCQVLVSEVPRPRMRDGRQRTDRSGTPEWVVGLCVMQQSRSDVIPVTVVGEPSGLGIGRPVVVVGLIAIPWENEGRHGIAYRADSISHEQPPAARAPRAAG